MVVEVDDQCRFVERKNKLRQLLECFGIELFFIGDGAIEDNDLSIYKDCRRDRVRRMRKHPVEA